MGGVVEATGATMKLPYLLVVLLSIAAPSCGGGVLGRISDGLPAMERGACAGLDALALEDAVPLMHGRVHFRVPEGLIIQGGRTAQLDYSAKSTPPGTRTGCVKSQR